MNKPKFEERKEANLAYIENRGPYDKVPWDEYMAKLYGWAKEQKVMPGFHPMAIYYDDPQQVSKERCRSNIGITFKGIAQEKGDIKIRSIPTMKVATVSFKEYRSKDRAPNFKGLPRPGPMDRSQGPSHQRTFNGNLFQKA